eukprot:GEMP01071393.1.p1 GENE.GEMP01071393.1~~GEMP01071393.1.p1  ORF type:complete len:252 (+),score=36.40 GEMP01071393.1:128-883(+)
MCAFALTTNVVKPDHPRSITRLDENRQIAFQKLKKRTWHLLEVASPSFARLLATNLSKETDWVVWKKGNCKESDRFYFRAPERLEPAKKRRRLATDVTQAPIQPYMDTLLGKLNEAARPSLDAALDQKVDQKDVSIKFFKQLWDEDLPENKIDEEYKMKNNKVFMWQARRLYCQQHLSSHGEMFGLAGEGSTSQHKNDFMGSIAKVLGKPYGASQPNGTSNANGPNGGNVVSPIPVPESSVPESSPEPEKS